MKNKNAGIFESEQNPAVALQSCCQALDTYRRAISGIIMAPAQ
ncbi:MAG: hypothetical protein QM683_10120 [Lacrimispora sp.]